MSSTTRSETALIRPYTSLEPTDAPLDAVRFLVGATEHEPGAVVLTEEDLAGSKLRLRLPDPATLRAAVAQTPVPEGDCGLVVIGASRSNRVAKVFLKEYLKVDAWSNEIELDRSSADLVLNDKAGYSLTVGVVLLIDLQPEPLRPYMAGTWLSRRQFSVGPERQDSSFSPEELTDDIRKQYGLREGVLKYFRVGDWSDAENLSDEVHVYVDRDTLHLLLASPTDPASLQLQVDLAVGATETVASTIARGLSTDGGVPASNSLDSYPAAKRFYDNLAVKLDLTLSDVLSLAFNEPATLRAHLEAAFDLRSITTASLKEK